MLNEIANPAANVASSATMLVLFAMSDYPF